MIDINDIAGLLHVEEKLRAHGGRFPAMLKAVMAKLDEYERAHNKPPEAGEDGTFAGDAPPAGSFDGTDTHAGVNDPQASEAATERRI